MGLAGLALVVLAVIVVFVVVLLVWSPDRASKNDRTSLPSAYELPRYFRLNTTGDVDTSVRWTGWDGWYFFMIPNEERLPLKLVRGSIMTGLYGLEGIDNYEQLQLRLSTSDAVEHLLLTPTEITAKAAKEKSNYLSHRYLPKRTDLAMRSDVLDVAVSGANVVEDDTSERYGRIAGQWPNYKFDFINPEAGITVALNCKAKNILWWADFRNLFTYFSAFADFEGTITYQRGTRRDDPEHLPDHEETYALKGRGSFEHGFARKPFDYDQFWFPVEAIRAIVPSLKAVRYHYELLTGDDGLHGGFMVARAFGISLRNRGGCYRDGVFECLKHIKIEYSNQVADKEQVGTCRGTDETTFYKRWTVRAVTDTGILEYEATREWPPASVSAHMIYYNFSFAGTYNGRSISGRGYGEFLNM
jgi:hypothetical protein